MTVAYSCLKPKGKPDLLSDEVPWDAMVGPGIVAQKDDYALQRSYLVRGPDLTHEADEVQGGVMLQVNEVCKRLGGEWMLQTEAQRVPLTGVPAVAWPHPVPFLLDQHHRAGLFEEEATFETVYYMTLTWKPDAPLLKRGLSFFIRGPGKPGQGEEATAKHVSVAEFARQADFLMGRLRGVLAVALPLSSAQTATYLHHCVSNRWYPLGDLADWSHLDQQLCTSKLDPAGWYPELGDDSAPKWHLRTVSIQGYPATSMVGIMRKLDALKMTYRWSTRWIGMERSVQAEILKKSEASWINQEKSVVDRMVENSTGRQTRVTDPTATNLAQDVNAARQEIGMNLTVYGQFTSVVVVYDADPYRVDTKIAMVMQVLANEGFLCTVEDEHLVATWLGSMPGNRKDNVRKTMQSGLTFAHLGGGLNATWPGPEWDTVLEEGPWFYAQTDGANLFRVVNHIAGVGHWLLLGQTGSGKSTLANFQRAMWMQRANRQAKLFDLGRTGRLLTYLLGGRWYDLGSPSLRIQPLRHVDDPLRYGIALQWLMELLAEYKVPRPEQSYAATQAYLGSNLRKLAQCRPEARTVSQLVALMADGSRDTELKARAGRIDAQGVSHPDMELKELVHLQLDIRMVLKRFTAGGEFAGVFDGTAGDLEAHAVQTFEMGSFKGREAVQGPMMRYALSLVNQQMRSSHPMALILDDAAINWLIPQGQEGAHTQKAKLQEQVQEWEMTARKHGVSVGFVTHSLGHVFNSAVGALLLESCPSRFLLPNKDALIRDIGDIYRRMGLTENAIHAIATGALHADVFYYARGLGSRMIALPFEGFALDCLARNAEEDHALIDRILAEEGPEGFAAGWFRHLGYLNAAHIVEQWAAPRGVGVEEGWGEAVTVEA